MSEEQFTDWFIEASINKNQGRMRDLCQSACRAWGDDKASELANDCYEALLIGHPELENWLNSWFDMGCWS